MARAAPLWLASPSRFAGLARRRARIGLVLLLVLLLACFQALTVREVTTGSAGPSRAQSDVVLYQTIVDGIRHGGAYYPVAAHALRAGDYPLRPFLTFRLPGLALIEGHLPRLVVLALFFALATAVVTAWTLRLLPALPRFAPRVVALVLLAGGMLAFVQPDLIVFHEIWAAQLVALSLVLRRPGHWVEAVAIAVLALLIRETAALYVAVMALFAWIEGERREAIGWAAALVLLAVVLGFHAHAVSQVTTPIDARSPGWLGLQGFGLFVRSVTLATGFTMLPLWLAAPLVGLVLFGWASWNDPLGLRAVAVFSAYAAAIAVFARPDTFYWGLMVAPVFLIGIAFVPDGIRDLVRSALDRRRVRVQRVAQ